MDKNNNSTLKNKQTDFLQLSNSTNNNNNNKNEHYLRRQKSISVPIGNSSLLYQNKCPSTPNPIRSSFYSHSSNNSPHSVDYEIFKNRNSSIDQGESMHFLQVHSPITRSGLPHQYSAESTESATSCLSGVSTTSQDVFSTDNFLRSTSENSAVSIKHQTSKEKPGLWPSFKKIIKDKKKPIFTKQKEEVRESYTDPVYHLLKCGANPNHNRLLCQCDCHQKEDQQDDGL